MYQDVTMFSTGSCNLSLPSTMVKGHTVCASFSGNAPVKVTVGLGRLFQVELLDLDGREGLSGNEFLHVPVQATTIGQMHLKPIEPSLPLLDAWLRAEAVFQK